MKKEYSLPEMLIIMLTQYDSDIVCVSGDVELNYGSGDNWTEDDVD